MIDDKMISSLKFLADRLKHTSKMGVSGKRKSSFARSWYHTADIDIATDKSGSFKINETLKEYEVKPVKFRQSKTQQSYIGEFLVNGIKVEVMEIIKRRSIASGKTLILA